MFALNTETLNNIEPSSSVVKPDGA